MTRYFAERETLDASVASLSGLNLDQLRLQWRNHLGGIAPAHLPGWLLMRVLAYRIPLPAMPNSCACPLVGLGQRDWNAF